MTRPLPPAFLQVPLAHRAYHDLAAGRPENSLAAVRAAIDAGYGIEIDVQPSRDSVPLVFHDYDLGRLTSETGPIRQRSAAEASAIPLTGGDEGIPTLAEVMAEVAGRVPLLIEVKDQDGAMGPDTGGIEPAVARVVTGYDGPLALMSFNPHTVARLAELLPEVACGLVSLDADGPHAGLTKKARDRLRDLKGFEDLGASFISHEAADLSRPRVAELKARGVPVLCWTIRSPEAEAEARKIADNITFEGYAAAFPA